MPGKATAARRWRSIRGPCRALGAASVLLAPSALGAHPVDLQVVAVDRDTCRHLEVKFQKQRDASAARVQTLRSAVGGVPGLCDWSSFGLHRRSYGLGGLVGAPQAGVQHTGAPHQDGEREGCHRYHAVDAHG